MSGNVAELDLGDLLQEFEDVVEELSAPSLSAPRTYEHLINEGKRRSGLSDGVSDSGIEDDGSELSRGNSLNASVEELNTTSMATEIKVLPTAKLGDTSDLESFIENLDKELAEM